MNDIPMKSNEEEKKTKKKQTGEAKHRDLNKL